MSMINWYLIRTQEKVDFERVRFWLSSIIFRIRFGVLSHEVLIADFLFLFNTSRFLNPSEMS